jgi:hypothetical protein
MRCVHRDSGGCGFRGWTIISRSPIPYAVDDGSTNNTAEMARRAGAKSSCMQ